MIEPAEKQQPVDMRLSLAKSLVASLEQGDTNEVDQLINSLTSQHESMLFQEIGKLTRQLHDALGTFRDDERIVNFAEDRIPDARERLNYVIDKTEESAHRTLNAVEEALPIAAELEANGKEMHEAWTKFTRREMNAEEFRHMSKRIESFLESVETDAKHLNKGLSDVMMAQDFQDLTGQIIRKVIELVHDLEVGLVSVIRNSGRVSASEVEQAEYNIAAEGPQINKKDNPDVMSGQDEVDDLLSSLGF